MISGRGRWEGPEEAAHGSRLWIRRKWSVGPVSVYESVFLRKKAGLWDIEHRRLCYLDEERQKRLAVRRVWRYMSVFWFWAYLLCSRWDIERDIEPVEARKRWSFLEESVLEWRRASIRELGL